MERAEGIKPVDVAAGEIFEYLAPFNRLDTTILQFLDISLLFNMKLTTSTAFLAIAFIAGEALASPLPQILTNDVEVIIGTCYEDSFGPFCRTTGPVEVVCIPYSLVVTPDGHDSNLCFPDADMSIFQNSFSLPRISKVRDYPDEMF